MPGLTPGTMNGDTDYGRPGHDRGYTNGYDPYNRDDPYRDNMRDDDLYRHPQRGVRPTERFNDQMADQNSVSDFPEPAFELDHLATFAAGGSKKGMMHAEDGLRKLRQMENTTGIWTMRCILLVERRFIAILDKNSGEELERFPVQFVQEPTAIFKNDRREIYNNLILFTVMEETSRRDAQADMHIFQSIRTPAQTVVDEIQASRRGQQRISSGGYKIPPPPSGPAPVPPGRSDPYSFDGFRNAIEHREHSQFMVEGYGGNSQFSNGGGGFLGGAQRSSLMQRPTYSPYREREDEMGSNELLERDVQLLNHCFDDIEKFVARLQQAAESYKELERRKRERGGKGKKNTSGDGMLGHRARPPPAADFVDVFQKFKLSFNLLAKLKAHIHDPNAPELVHFLFTPLSLIYEASRDPVHGSVNLGEQALAPILTPDAKQLLLNCLTSKEIELWQALGKSWTTSKDEWKGHIPPYVPRFYDGWQPAPTLVEEPAYQPPNLDNAVRAHHDQIRSRALEQEARLYAHEQVAPFPSHDEDRFHRTPRDFDFEPDPRAPTPPRNALGNPSVAGYQQYVEQHIERNIRSHDRRPEPVIPANNHSTLPMRPPDDNAAYLAELRKSGAKIRRVLHDRQGKNAKELNVVKGDILQVIEDNRNWWKVRNYKGESGFCPYTILEEVPAGDRDGYGEGEPDRRSTRGADYSLSSHHSAPYPDRSSPRSAEPPITRTGRGPDPEALVPSLDSGRQGAPPGYRSQQESFSDAEEHSVIQSLSLSEEEERDWQSFRPVGPAAPYGSKGPIGVHKTRPQDQLHKELQSRMALGGAGPRRGDRAPPEARRRSTDLSLPSTALSSQAGSPEGSVMGDGGQPFYVSAQSSQAQVAQWLHAKGFTALCRDSLAGFTGRDLLGLHRQEMDQLLGHEEAARLEGQLTLQKKMTGYKTQSAAELNAIFQKRRARTEQKGTSLGQAPEFRPVSPASYDGPESDSEFDDERQLADTGKTLRDLLIRQRQKIVGAGVFDPQ